ncbi:MAG: arsenite methyltransferase, partial [Deltaproteobacteria bacterium]|nr:arsenite methyltransferase [Deltaproteobacteria bacterium]
MKTRDKEEIRKAVRDSYGKVARIGTKASGLSPALSCCGEQGISDTKRSSASCCGAPELTPEQMSKAMGYSRNDLDNTPEGANLGLGCGNPVALASLKPGETVVDLGSGGGFDCFLAANEVGKDGKVIGIDMTPDMISKARKIAQDAGIDNVEFRLGEIEHLPVADNSADIIMSNCVINLSPDKQSVFKDAFRALKPGGRLAISDILATKELPAEIKNDLALYSACIGGAATLESTVTMLEQTGFRDIIID